MKPNNSEPELSIIIPTLNEEVCIGDLLGYIRQEEAQGQKIEIIVADGGSSDQTKEIAGNHGAVVVEGARGRAVQMNTGAEAANGRILYFLHADTRPPRNFISLIVRAVDAHHQAGCFSMRFDSDSYFLNFFAWFSRLNYLLCRGGDQSLFITASLFNATGGFDTSYMVYEDTEYVGRLYKHTSFRVLQQQVVTSARKYEELGKYRLQYHFSVIHLKRLFGAGPEQLYSYYKRNISA